MKKAAALIVEQECDIETDEFCEFPDIKNKTVTLTKKVKDCKPFVASSILFVCVSVISTGVITYFYCKSRNNNLIKIVLDKKVDLGLK